MNVEKNIQNYFWRLATGFAVPANMQFATASENN
jgi:hypothetical protein